MYDMILAFITAFFLTYLAIPSVIHIAKIKHLFDEPNERSSHTVVTPSLGGIAIFAGVIFAITFWTPFKHFTELQYILCSLIIMFLVGAKDDILPMSPKKKFIGQIIAAAILVYKAEVQITSFHGLLGIEVLPEWISVIFTIVTIIFIINAFNLIDGINGLAGTIGTMITITFGIWFLMVGEIALAIISFSLSGALVGFLNYNYTPAKIFMGDTGSLLVGLVTSMLAIQFIEINIGLDSPYAVKAAPAVAIGIMIVPMIDTLRVFTTRILKGKSPFNPDKTHIHHLCLRLGLSHTQGTLLLATTNFLFIVLVYFLKDISTLGLMLIVFGLAILLTYILYAAVKKKEAKAIKSA